jgi:ADP-ribose pyrophosphatase
MSQRRVEIVERKRVYDGFFKLDVARVRHELFRGGMSPELKREVFVQRQAVAVLPYDPRTDRVVLVEQFRAGTIDWGGEPWLLEAVAGILDKDGEAVEAAAKREVKEECGLELGRLDFAGLYASSPGGTTERVHTFVGEVTAPESGGVHGLASEHEDIRLTVVPAEEAFAMFRAGRIVAADTIVPLQHLMLHHDRLRREWGSGDMPRG